MDFRLNICLLLVIFVAAFGVDGKQGSDFCFGCPYKENVIK